MRIFFAIVFLLVLTPTDQAKAQTMSDAVQVASAITPLPASMQQNATVMGYNSDGELVMLREGSNEMMCLADIPGDERFHVACYDKRLDPFMSRGRALSAEGKGRQESRDIRQAEIEAGTLSIPDGPAALYQLFGGPTSLNTETGEVSEVNPLYVVYIPYATPESTGIGEDAPMPGAPWLMDAGLPWAHIMYAPSR